MRFLYRSFDRRIRVPIVDITRHLDALISSLFSPESGVTRPPSISVMSSSSSLFCWLSVLSPVQIAEPIGAAVTGDTPILRIRRSMASAIRN